LLLLRVKRAEGLLLLSKLTSKASNRRNIHVYGLGTHVDCSLQAKLGGIPDIAKDRENMLLFNSGDIHTLTACLELLIKNENLRYKLSEASSYLAQTTFNVDNINKQIDGLYERLLKKK
jgi:glycosyltransferase involved in cell wall biosynthesis